MRAGRYGKGARPEPDALRVEAAPPSRPASSRGHFFCETMWSTASFPPQIAHEDAVPSAMCMS